jgi:hypothetical protein
MPNGWRYLAQNLVTGEWVGQDLELRDVEIEIALSGPGGISASIAPELVSVTSPDGRGRLLAEWQTAIYAEDPSGNIYAGILTRSEAEDDTQKWSIECPGFSSYPHGLAYDGEWRQWRPDAFAVVRHLWAHVQSHEDGDLGMVVTATDAGVGVGDEEPPARPKNVAQALKVPTRGARPVQGADELEVDYLARVEEWEELYAARLAIYKSAAAKKQTAKERLASAQQEWDTQFRDRAKYELAWWEATDVGEEIDRLATEVPFEYVERHRWNADRTEVLHFLDLYHPMAGTRRADLRFAVGENVVVIPAPEYDGDSFASEVVGLGKGDGRKMLRTKIAKRTGRLRRQFVLALKDVGNKVRLRALADDELRKRLELGDVAELVVIDHTNAPFGSWTVGDEVFISAGGEGWFHEDMWVRIVSTRITPDQSDTIRLTVVNSERVTS